MSKNNPIKTFFNGLITENPTFVLMLGMCPTLAVTTSAINGLGMGLTTTAVLVLSNLMISLLRKVIPDGVRIPAFIVVIATFVTVIQLLLQGYIPSLYASLGIYIPLIVVNCIILGRAEAFASKNNIFLSIFEMSIRVSASKWKSSSSILLPEASFLSSLVVNNLPALRSSIERATN